MDDAKSYQDKTFTNSKPKLEQLSNKSLTNVPLSKLDLNSLDGITGGLVRFCNGMEAFDPYKWAANDTCH